MTYVVAWPAWRFEIRESLQTAKGPRARSLVNFGILTDQVLAVAAGRAERPNNAQAVMSSARRVGAPVTAIDAQGDPRVMAETTENSRRHFVESSRRIAQAMAQPPTRERPDPGPALIDLLGFADAIVSSSPPRSYEPLSFPVLARITEPRCVGANPV